MENIGVQAFFSRSFSDRALEYTSLIETICNALNIKTVCVNSGSSNTPSKTAKDLIQSSDFLIALCSRDIKIDGEEAFIMPAAVREEIVVADTAEIPIICFVEDKVRVDGFLANRLTYEVVGEIEKINTDVIGKLIKGIHDTKLRAIDEAESATLSAIGSSYYYESVKTSVELEKLSNGWCWTYIFEKRMNFTSDEKGPLTHMVWAPNAPSDASGTPLHELYFELNGIEFTPRFSQKSSPSTVDIKSYYEPELKKGDSLFVREKYRSPYLNPIHDAQEHVASVLIGGKLYGAYDGICVVKRIEALEIEVIFPEKYNIGDYTPFAATFSNEIDQIHEKETTRLQESQQFTQSVFNAKRRFILNVDRPKYQLMYGLAWALPRKCDWVDKLASNDLDWNSR